MIAWLLGFAAIVAASGATGGLVNAAIVNNRSLLDDAMAEEAGLEQKKRAHVGRFYAMNGFLGAVAACISWLAYGPYSTMYVVGRGQTIPEAFGVTALALAAAFFIGMGGTKWLQSERDKGRWQAAAYDAARAEPSHDLARNLSLASSDQAPLIAAREAAKSQRNASGGRKEPRARNRARNATRRKLARRRSVRGEA